MRSITINPVYLLLLIVVIIGVDVLFLRGRFWARLGANVVIVLIFVAVYVLFLRRR